jgi:hypothetical protein
LSASIIVHFISNISNCALGFASPLEAGASIGKVVTAMVENILLHNFNLIVGCIFFLFSKREKMKMKMNT